MTPMKDEGMTTQATAVKAAATIRSSTRLRTIIGVVALLVATLLLTSGSAGDPSALTATPVSASETGVLTDGARELPLARDFERPALAAEVAPAVIPAPSPVPAAAPAGTRTATKAATSAKTAAARTTTTATKTAAITAAPKPAAAIGAPCPDGSGIESGLKPNAIKVYRAVCAKFPSITSWGGYHAGTGYHALGRAVDIMVSGSTGTAVANYVIANASSLGVIEVIYQQRIWSPGKGWHALEDRGSVTANHFDHVHVSVR